MEQVLAQNLNLKQNYQMMKEKEKQESFEIKGYKAPSSKRVKDIVDKI